MPLKVLLYIMLTRKQKFFVISVSNGFDENFCNYDEEYTTCVLELDGDVSSLVNGHSYNAKSSSETDSVNYPGTESLRKPKFGVLKKVNLVIRCMLNSKL